MANRRIPQQKNKVPTSPLSNVDRLKGQLEKLIHQKSYRQALEKSKQIQKMHPETELSPSVSEIWTLRGRQEYGQGQYRQAETSFRQALDLGSSGEAHYWVAKSLLALDDAAAALELLQSAYENEQLHKDYAGCYLKLLLLRGETTQVSALLAHASKRFTAAQMHWVRGVLSFQNGNPQEAIAHFQKMGRTPATPGDSPQAWIAYMHQQQGQWEKSETVLGLDRSVGLRSKGLSSGLPKHPAIERLGLVQTLVQPKVQREGSAIEIRPGPQRTLSLVLQLLHLLETSNYHNAAHVFLNLGYPCQDFPEADALFRPVLILASEQALREGELDCVASFLEAIVYQPPFDAQIAVKLYQVYEREGYPIQSVQRVLSRLSDAVKQEALDHPGRWPTESLNLTLAQIQCWLTDAWMGRGQHKQGFKALQTAEKLCPDSAEVIGRQGLAACIKGQFEQAIPLMTQALEGGCQYGEVYEQLLAIKERQGDRSGIKEIRRRFGKQFGDFNAELEVEVPRWVEALTTQDYWIFEELVSDKDSDPALKACRSFVAAVEGEISQSGRVTLNLTRAEKDWERLLQGLLPQEQISVLQAIFLCIQLFVKRQKGIAALQTQYLQRLLALAEQAPEAKVAHLALLVVKGEPLTKWQKLLDDYLSASAQPGTALAQVQLKARRFCQSVVLRSMLNEALRREPQNPQLLLAKATTYGPKSQDYQTFHTEGFELARRLQDAQSLQAYREEETLRAERMTADFMPDFADFVNPAGPDLMDMVRQMARKMFGSEVPPKLLEQMLPDLMQMLEREMSNFDDEEEDFFDGPDFYKRDSFGQGLPFEPVPIRIKRKASKGRRGF